IEALNGEIQRYINGTFNWDYRNTNNKTDFLAFRGGNYYYDDSSLNAQQYYDAVHQKIKEHKLTIDVSFNYDIEDIFVHPERGGYVVSQILSIRVNSDDPNVEVEGVNLGEWHSVRYETEFNFKTLNSWDNWTFWYQGDYGLLINGFDYRIGSF
ncbi:hypothetical protein, partial [Leifsonia shinshuensis]|uniref:hypothetical protein n=1 Tax=Leifsonia shinshuensis TaxID=150026 RepID=UPI0035ECAE59